MLVLRRHLLLHAHLDDRDGHQLKSALVLGLHPQPELMCPSNTYPGPAFPAYSLGHLPPVAREQPHHLQQPDRGGQCKVVEREVLRSTCSHASAPVKIAMLSVHKVYRQAVRSDEVLCDVGWLWPPCWSSGAIFFSTPISTIATHMCRSHPHSAVNGLILRYPVAGTSRATF